MFENPLLPNAKLKQLYALMQRARGTGRGAAGRPRAEAILCATLMHLEPGDYVCTSLNDPMAATLAAEATSAAKSATLPSQATTNRLATSAGIAQGLRMAGDNRLSVLFLQSGGAILRTDPTWAAALTYAANAELPLLVICADGAEPTSAKVTRGSNAGALTWASIQRLAKPLHLPVLCVDGSDAVAVYRVLQEATLRARTSGGTAVIWCLLPATTTAANDPLGKMKHYLAARNLLPKPAVAARKKRTR